MSNSDLFSIGCVVFGIFMAGTYVHYRNAANSYIFKHKDDDRLAYAEERGDETHNVVGL
jgi:hypothetical protein